MLQRAKLELASILSFGYPTWPWLKADIGTASRELRRLLIEEYSRFGHYIFITHSAGGIVVKEMLRQDLHDACDGDAQGRLKLVPRIAYRTRRIFNFAVPHQGAQRLLSAILRIWILLNRVVTLYAAIKSRLGAGEERVGLNLLIRQLLYRNHWLAQLDQAYNRLLREMEVAGFPRPIMVDILGDSDSVITGETEPTGSSLEALLTHSDSEEIQTRPNHVHVHLPRHPNDLVVTIIANRIRAFAPAIQMMLAKVTHDRTIEIDGQDDLYALVSDDPVLGASDVRDSSEAKSEYPCSGSQVFVRGELSRRVKRGADRPMRYVVTGDAGVGKSVVLRRFARTLAGDVLQVRSAVNPLPMLIPMQQLPLPEHLAGTRETVHGLERQILWQFIRDYWCDWANDLIRTSLKITETDEEAAKHITWLSPEWMDEQLARRPTVLILDGVDEFLANNPTVEVTDLVRLLDWLESMYSKNRRLSILLGVRKSLPTLNILFRSRSDVFEVLPLSIEQANLLFPGAKDLIDRVGESSARLILTPLVLVQLGPRINELHDHLLRTRAGILDQAVEALIDRGNVVAGIPPSQSGRTIADWKDALTVIAWAFFVDNLGSIGQAELRDKLLDMLRVWDNLKVPAPGALHQGFDLALSEHDRVKRRLWDRTIFISIGQNAIRFRHREWEDSLAARYIARCIEEHNFEALHHRVLNKAVYISAGEELMRSGTSLAISEGYVEELLGFPDDARGCVVLNFFGVLGNCLLPVSKEAAELLVDHLRSVNCADNTRMVGITGLTRRVIQDHPEDNSLPILRERVISLLKEIIAPAHRTNAWPQFFRSLAWCYLKGYAWKFSDDTVDPRVSWPQLTNEPEHIQSVINSQIVCTQTGRRYRQDMPQYSFQKAVAGYPLVVRGMVDEETSAMHYFYLAIAAFSRGVTSPEINTLLNAVFSANSGFKESIDRYKQVPELREIYVACRNVYQRRTPASDAHPSVE